MGRPPLDPDDPAVAVHLKLPSKEFDQWCARAAAARITMPEMIRRELRKEKDPKP